MLPHRPGQTADGETCGPAGYRRGAPLERSVALRRRRYDGAITPAGEDVASTGLGRFAEERSFSEWMAMESGLASWGFRKSRVIAYYGFELYDVAMQ